MNEIILGIFIGVSTVAGVGVLIWFMFVKTRKSQTQEQGAGSLVLIQNQLEELRRAMDQKLGDSATMFQRQFSESMGIVKDVTEKLTKLDETNKQVISFADQLRNLQDILKNPKQRGILGEYYLETLLKNVLPPGSYQMQYGFPDGTIVDAAVFVKEKIIPVDSKFSLENYNRIAETSDQAERDRLEKLFVNDLKNRIVETSKYIQPEQGTTDFAFMFIPHEAVYYDLLVNKIGAITEETENLIQRAAGKYRVIIVSPTSFLAYLQTVLQGLKAMQIEESAKEIIKKVDDLRRHLLSYEEYMKRLGANLGTTISSYNSAYKEFAKVDKDVLKITASEGEGIQPLRLQKPDSLQNE